MDVQQLAREAFCDPWVPVNSVTSPNLTGKVLYEKVHSFRKTKIPEYINIGHFYKRDSWDSKG